MDDHAAGRPWSARTLDQVLPEDLGWEEKVLSYPIAALFAAAGLGFFLGRTRGAGLLSILTAAAAERVANSIAKVLDDEP